MGQLHQIPLSIGLQALGHAVCRWTRWAVLAPDCTGVNSIKWTSVSGIGRCGDLIRRRLGSIPVGLVLLLAHHIG